MFSAKALPYSLLLFVLSLGFAVAIPTWEGMSGRASMGSLIPGTSYIEAKGPASEVIALHLSTHVPDTIGNLSLVHGKYRGAPPLFYINQKQLWLLVNETTVYPVNVHNVTNVHHEDIPFQLVLGKKQDGIRGGEWSWKSTMLHYTLPGVLEAGNHGLFMHCMTYSGNYNLFIQANPAAPPPGCFIATLHGFMRSDFKYDRR